MMSKRFPLDGYEMEWGGEVESSSDAQASPVGPMMVAILIMYLC